MQLPKQIEDSAFNGYMQEDLALLNGEHEKRQLWLKTKREYLDGLLRERFRQPELTHKQFRGSNLREISGYRSLK